MPGATRLPAPGGGLLSGAVRGAEAGAAKPRLPALRQPSPGARAPQAATCWGWQRLALWQCCPRALPPQILLVPKRLLQQPCFPQTHRLPTGREAAARCVGKVTPSRGRAPTRAAPGLGAHSPGERRAAAGRTCSCWAARAAWGPSGLWGAPAPAALGGAAAPRGGTASAGTRQLSAMGW